MEIDALLFKIVNSPLVIYAPQQWMREYIISSLGEGRCDNPFRVDEDHFCYCHWGKRRFTFYSDEYGSQDYPRPVIHFIKCQDLLKTFKIK